MRRGKMRKEGVKMVGGKGEDEEGRGKAIKLLQPGRTIVNSVTL